MTTLHSLAWTSLALLLCGSRPVAGAEMVPPEPRRGSVLAAHQIDSLGLGPLRVAIDIVPEKKQNQVQPGRWDFLPVAILGSPGFDVLNVDRESLVFGPSGARPSNGRSWRVRDVNGDGHTDLLTFYRTRETGIVEGDSRACLTGATVSGTRFEGCDSVETATKKRVRAKRSE